MEARASRVRRLERDCPEIIGRKTQSDFLLRVTGAATQLSRRSGSPEKVFEEFWKPPRGRFGVRRGGEVLDDHKSVDFSL
jgi:hypothetical protein